MQQEAITQDASMKVGSKRPRASDASRSLASLVPLEDMSDPRQQLELREVIIVSARDSALRIRTTTNILFKHSQQLLNAARDVDAPLPLDCSAATMGILDDLFWAEPWEKSVDALTCEELIDLFEVAHAWQIDVLALRMPAWVGGRDGWKCQQLQDLYERAELPDDVQQAALGRMLALGFVAQLTCPRAGDLCTIMHHFVPQRIYDAVKYLGSAKLSMLSPHVAMALLAQFDKMAEQCARRGGKYGQLQLVDALQHMRTYQIPLRKAVMYYAVRLDPEAGGVKSVDLGICIEDMLTHHLREAIQDETMPDPKWQSYADMLHIPAPRITVRKSWTGYLRCTP